MTRKELLKFDPKTLKPGTAKHFETRSKVTGFAEHHYFYKAKDGRIFQCVTSYLRDAISRRDAWLQADHEYTSAEKYMIELYCGISLPALLALNKLHHKLITWKSVNANTKKYLSDKHLAAGRSGGYVNFRGRHILHIHDQILKGKFKPSKPMFTEAEFNHLSNTFYLTKLDIVKKEKLQSAHLKAIRMIARVPNISCFQLQNVFSERILDELVYTAKLVQKSPFEEMRLTDRGKQLLRECVEKAKSHG
jgi:hypothetical protein